LELFDLITFIIIAIRDVQSLKQTSNTQYMTHIKITTTAKLRISIKIRYCTSILPKQILDQISVVPKIFETQLLIRMQI